VILMHDAGRERFLYVRKTGAKHTAIHHKHSLFLAQR
jgi:hypothetical protein